MLNDEKQAKYRSGIGILPDIVNSVHELSKVNSVVLEAHYNELLRLIKYVFDTRDYGLQYDLSKYDSKILSKLWEIMAYCDSDCAGVKETRKSVTGYGIYLMAA